MGILWEELKKDQQGLIPVIVQDKKSGRVLMMAYMNEEAFQKTQETGTTWFYSRSRKTLWNKGETSGHIQRVKEMYLDCDNDTLLLEVEQEGVACHTGFPSCFHRQIKDGKISAPQKEYPPYAQASFLQELFEVIEERALYSNVHSYTSRLFQEGKEKILRKIAEETTEVILAAFENKPTHREHLQWEVADLLYHLLVLLKNEGLSYYEVIEELQKRRSSLKGETSSPKTSDNG
ncbi:MAG: bifunctional phosphoribosyl-AMP cyclohydrolase/phosphoribosyl-ATP diphosphatase HisIE [Candidatus Caldatribacteriaceae bacterium]